MKGLCVNNHYYNYYYIIINIVIIINKNIIIIIILIQPLLLKLLRLLVLVSYQGRLTMTLISARAVREIWTVIHSLCICVICHGYGGLGVSTDGGEGWQAYRKSQEE